MKLSHPQSKHDIDVDADQVDTYTSQGWEPKSESKKNEK